MERVKIFCAPDVVRLENKINAWLDSMGDHIEITRMTQYIAYGIYGIVEDPAGVITIFYKTK